MTTTTQLQPLRYNSPTVTLEVMTKAAAVSQWSDKPIVQVLRYQIQIRDLNDETTPIEIRGDRTTFLPLVQAVETYVQSQLGDSSALPQTQIPPYLEAQGLTQHTLYLDRDRTPSGPSQITLGAIQLADLEQVLDDLNQAVRPLPVSLVAAHQRRPWRQWGATAAGLVAAVGVTTVLWPNYQSQQSLETAQPVPTTDQETALSPDSLELEDSAGSEDPTSNTPASSNTDISDTPPAADESGAIASDEPSTESELSGIAAAPAPSPPVTTSTPTVQTEVRPEPFSDETSGNAASPPVAELDTPEPTSPPGSATPPPTTTEALPTQPPSNPESAAGSTAETAETFSDTVPQRAARTPAAGSLVDFVQQVRDRWTPPANLDQTLTYTLIFAADGTLMDVIPADELAVEYRDRTNIPPVGTVVIAPGAPQRVRLLLRPNGDVESRADDPEP